MAAKKTSMWLVMLEPTQKEAIKKMSTERATNKLRKLGYTDEELSSLSREDLLDRWAQTVLTGEDKAAPAGITSNSLG
jgi:hypothetical protein